MKKKKCSLPAHAGLNRIFKLRAMLGECAQENPTPPPACGVVAEKKENTLRKCKGVAAV